MNYYKPLAGINFFVAIELYFVAPEPVYAKIIDQVSNQIDSQQQSTRAPHQTSQFGQLVGSLSNRSI